MDIGLWFITGVLISFHCIAMCGTMVASYAVNDSGDPNRRVNYLPHIAYNGARLASYTLVGATLGFLGSVVNFGPIRGGVSIFAGLFMIIMGLNMLNIFPWLRFLQIRIPKSVGRFIYGIRTNPRAASGDGGKRPRLGTPLLFGLLTGFMPCGPLQAMQLFAAGSGSALRGSAAMFIFGLGTVPLLMGFGTFTSAIGHVLKKKVMKVASVVVIVLGLVMLSRGLVLQGVPYNLNTAFVFLKAQVGIADGDAGEARINKDKDIQEATLVIDNVRFIPSTLNLKAGVPVKLTIDRRENNICSDELVIPQIGVRKPLTPFGKTFIEFTPDREGALNLTCQMGMMQATAYVGGGGAKAARSGANPFFTFLAGAVLAWIVITLKNTPGFINLPKPVPAPAAARARRTRSGRRTDVPRLEISYGTFAVVAIIAIAILAGLYLGAGPSPQSDYANNPAPSRAPATRGQSGASQDSLDLDRPATNAGLTREAKSTLLARSGPPESKRKQ